MKVYTKTGDSGTTSTYTGARRSKADLLFDVLGETDRLIVILGKARFDLDSTNNYNVCTGFRHLLIDSLLEIQQTLFKVQSIIASTTRDNPPTSSEIKIICLDPKLVSKVESWIDEMDAHLPALRQFILPSGKHQAVFDLHEARVQCRAVERLMVRKNEHERRFHRGSGDLIPEEVMKLVNRLSDLFFTQARFFNWCVEVKDTPVTIN